MIDDKKVKVSFNPRKAVTIGVYDPMMDSISKALMDFTNQISDESERMVCPPGKYEVGYIRESHEHNKVIRLLAKNDKCFLWQTDVYDMAPGPHGIEQYIPYATDLSIQYMVDGEVKHGKQGFYQSAIQAPKLFKPYPLLHSLQVGYVRHGDKLRSNSKQYSLIDQTMYFIDDVAVFTFTMKCNITGLSMGKSYVANHAGRCFDLSNEDPLKIRVKVMEKLTAQLQK